MSPVARSNPRCPSCHVRYYVPRPSLTRTSVIAIPLDPLQLRSLYSLAAEFIEGAGGERPDATEVCAECGRWSIVAFLDWLAPDVRRQQEGTPRPTTKYQKRYVTEAERLEARRRSKRDYQRRRATAA